MTAPVAPLSKGEPAPDAELADDLATRPVTPRLRPWRWVATVVVLVVLAQFVYGLFANDAFEWDKFGQFFTRDSVLQGVVTTLELTGWSALLGLVFGVLLAVARLSTNPLFNGLSWLYIWVFRSLPLPLLMIFVYNVSYFWPSIGLGLPFGPTFVSADTGGREGLLTGFWVGVVALTINEAAFAAEVVRGGIASVDQGQIEAANALGLSRPRQLRRVILPQALRSIIPAYGNQLIGLIKASSLVYYASILDVFGQIFVLSSRHPESVVIILIVGAAWYLIITAALSVLQFYVERYFARGAVRNLPPTPLQRLRRLCTTWAGAGWRPVRRGL